MKATITPNGSGFAVYLLSAPDRKGFCAATCRGLFAIKAEAQTEAARVGALYRCPIEDRTQP
jgi:hypothetical protein